MVHRMHAQFIAVDKVKKPWECMQMSFNQTDQLYSHCCLRRCHTRTYLDADQTNACCHANYRSIDNIFSLFDPTTAASVAHHAMVSQV